MMIEMQWTGRFGGFAQACAYAQARLRRVSRPQLQQGGIDGRQKRQTSWIPGKASRDVHTSAKAVLISPIGMTDKALVFEELRQTSTQE